jgi:lysophospholipase L1-like esterase
MPPVSWPEMFAEDRFHPNAAAYRALAAHIAAALTTHGLSRIPSRRPLK